MTENNTLKKKYFSQSGLKDWDDMTPMRWYKTHITKELKKPDRPATTLGSVLDCLMFESKDEFDKRFMVADITLPSTNVMLIVNDLFEFITNLNKRAYAINHSDEAPELPIPMKEFNITDHKDYVISLSKKHDYYATKPDQAFNAVVKNGTAYLEFLQQTQGRKVITKKDVEIAESLKEVLLTDPEVKGFFVPKKDCEVLFQVTIYGEYEVDMLGVENIEILPLIGKLDIIHINHKRKEIREVDLKYTADISQFKMTLKRLDYPFQHSFYDHLIRQWISTFREGALADYSVMNPLNVVIDDIEKIPLIYEYKETDLYIKKHGLETPNRLVFKGWTHILNEIAYHLEKNNWKRPVEHLRNGKITVNVFNK